jgi:hypothetical protein
MKITRRQLRNIISEEVSSSVNEAITIPPEIKKKGAEVGMAIILSMVATPEGREKLAGLLVAIPDFIKLYLCNAPEGWLSSAEGRVGPAIGAAFGMLCRFGVTVPFSPLYALAWLLRLLSDDEAQIIISQAPKPDQGEHGEVESEEEVDISSGFSGGLEAYADSVEQPAIAETFSIIENKILSKLIKDN